MTPSEQIGQALTKLDEALRTGDPDAAVVLFADECYWRDLLAFTWNITTLEGKTEVGDMLAERLADVAPAEWRVVEPDHARSEGGITEGFVRFETAVAHGHGYIRLRDGLIWTLLTGIENLTGHEEALGFSRPSGGRHGAHLADATWVEQRAAEASRIGVTSEPYVVIVGGGHGGIMLAARLRQLDVPTIVVEKNARPGDNWRKRYKTLQLHNPIWENDFPYLKYPDNWPVFMDKDKYGEWLETYTRLMELNYWSGTEATSATYDEVAGRWTVTVETDGSIRQLHPAHLVLATGLNGQRPVTPVIAGQDEFAGIQQHSCDHPGPDGMGGKRVVVIGSGTSAHDICAALALEGADVTMVQRSPTHVVRMESFLEHQIGDLHSPEARANGLTTELADLITGSVPYALFFDFQRAGVDRVREVDAAFYEALDRIGFRYDFGPRGSGLFGKALTGVFNYYIEIGATQLMLDGRIKLASTTGVQRITRDAVVLDDGRELPAEVIVYATGFESISQTAAEIVSRDVMEKVGRVTGIGSGGPRDPGPWEGEIRNLAKPTAQEGLWFFGSLIPGARFDSHYLAVQLKARMEGIPTPVYQSVRREAVSAR